MRRPQHQSTNFNYVPGQLQKSITCSCEQMRPHFDWRNGINSFLRFDIVRQTFWLSLTRKKTEKESTNDFLNKPLIVARGHTYEQGGAVLKSCSSLRQ